MCDYTFAGKSAAAHRSANQPKGLRFSVDRGQPGEESQVTASPAPWKCFWTMSNPHHANPACVLADILYHFHVRRGRNRLRPSDGHPHGPRPAILDEACIQKGARSVAPGRGASAIDRRAQNLAQAVRIIATARGPEFVRALAPSCGASDGEFRRGRGLPLAPVAPTMETDLAGRPYMALSNRAGCQSFFCALSAILRAASLIAPLALPTAF